MSATAQVIWLRACVSYWPGRGLVSSVSIALIDCPFNFNSCIPLYFVLSLEVHYPTEMARIGFEHDNRTKDGNPAKIFCTGNELLVFRLPCLSDRQSNIRRKWPKFVSRTKFGLKMGTLWKFRTGQWTYGDVTKTGGKPRVHFRCGSLKWFPSSGRIPCSKQIRAIPLGQ